MKICLINPTKVLRRPIVEICRLLAEKGHKISLMFPDDVHEPLKEFHFSGLLEHQNIKLIKIPSYYIASLRYAIPNPFRLLKEAWKILKENDVIHIWEYYYPYSSVPVLLNYFKGKPLILTTDGFLGYSTLFESLWIKVFAKIYTQIFARWFLFKACKKFTVYGNPLVPFAHKLGISDKRLVVLGTGINLKKFENVKGDARKEFNIKADEVFILYIGMLTERKRIDVLIDTAVRLLDDGYKATFVLAGEGPFRKQYEERVPSKYRNKIIFAGQRADVPVLLKSCDVLFLPSLGEGLPGVVMEAAASGKPSVATDEGCTADIVIHGKTGYLAEPFRTGQYYDFLKELIKSKDLRNKMGIAARQHISKFEWKDVIKRYEKLYEEVVRK